jgi:hypothetical protein
MMGSGTRWERTRRTGLALYLLMGSLISCATRPLQRDHNRKKILDLYMAEVSQSRMFKRMSSGDSSGYHSDMPSAPESNRSSPLILGSGSSRSLLHSSSEIFCRKLKTKDDGPSVSSRIIIKKTSSLKSLDGERPSSQPPQRPFNTLPTITRSRSSRSLNSHSLRLPQKGSRDMGSLRSLSKEDSSEEERRIVSGVLKMASINPDAFKNGDVSFYGDSLDGKAKFVVIKKNRKISAVALRLGFGLGGKSGLRRMEKELNRRKDQLIEDIQADEKIKGLSRKSLESSIKLKMGYIGGYMILFLELKNQLVSKLKPRSMQTILDEVLEEMFSVEFIKECIFASLRKRHKGLYKKILSIRRQGESRKSCCLSSVNHGNLILELNKGLIIESRHKFDNRLEACKTACGIPRIIFSASSSSFSGKGSDGAGDLKGVRKRFREIRRDCACEDAYPDKRRYLVCTPPFYADAEFLIISLYPWRMSERGMYDIHEDILKGIKRAAEKRQDNFLNYLKLALKVKRLRYEIKFSNIEAREETMRSLVFYFEIRGKKFTRDAIQLIADELCCLIYGNDNELVRSILSDVESKYRNTKLWHLIRPVCNGFIEHGRLMCVSYTNDASYKKESTASWFGRDYTVLSLPKRQTF